MSVNVGSAIAYLDLDTSRFISNLSAAKSALQDFASSSNTLSTKFQNLGSSVSSFGSYLTKTVTVPLVGLGTVATKVAGDFESSMSKVEAISGATGDEMSQLRDKAIEMGAKTKFSAKESADAFTYMAMAGWDAGQMIDGIGGIMSLAAADGLDLATTSDIVTDALTAFGLQASDAGHFADVLAQASSSANTNVSMLGESFKYVAPVAGSLGMSVEDTALALGLMANAGIKSSQAGTTLRTSLTNLVKPTDNMAAKMEELGIEVVNSDGSMKSLRDIMIILRDKFSVLSEAEQANAAATIFGKEAMSGMLAIINASENDFNSLANAIDNSTGRADDMADTMMNNLNGAITLLKSALESLAIKIGTALTPVIKEIAEWITKVVEWLNTLSDEQIQQIVRIAAIVAAIGPLLIIIGKIISAVATIITVIGQVGTAVSGIIKIGSVLIGGVAKLAGMIPALITAIAGISPVVFVVIAAIAALIAIGVALYKNWDDVCDWAERTWKAIKETIGNAIDAVIGFFANLIQKNIEFQTKIITGLLELITTITSAISEFFSNLISNVSNWLSNVMNKLSNFVSNAISSISSFIDRVTNSIANFFDSLLTSVSNFFNNLWNTLTSWISNIKDSISDFISNLLNTVKDFISNLKSSVTGFLGELFNTITSWLSNAINAIQNFASNVISAFGQMMSNIISRVVSGFSNLVSSIMSFASKFAEIGSTMFNNLFNGMKSVWSKIEEWASSMADKIADFFRDPFDWILNVIDSITSKVNAIKNTLSNVVSKVTSVVSGSHANGLDYVPYNGYVAELHEGERVLTREENEEYNRGRSGGGDTYIFNSPEPIDEYQAARLMKQTKQELDMDV